MKGKQDMKKHIILALTAAAFVLTACEKDFLERYPEGGTIRQDQYEKLDNQLEGSVRGMYARLYTMSNDQHDEFGKRSIDLWGDILASDIALTGKTYGWLYTDEQMLTTNRTGTIWGHYYSQIHNINATIRAFKNGNTFVTDLAENGWPSELKAAGMTKAQMDSIYNKVAYTNALYYAQVLGLRGYMYSQLAKFYTPVQESEKFLADSLGNFDCIPLYLEDNMDAVQPLSTAAVVYNQAFSDLEMSIKLFEEFGASYTRSSKLELDREVVCGILAYAYLNECVYRAGTPLYADHVQKALANAEKVINSNKYQTLKENQLLTTGFNSVTDPGWIWAQEVTIETSGGLKSWFGQVDIHSYSYAWAGDTKVIDATLRDMIPAWDKRRKWFNDGKANSIYKDCPDGKFFSAQNPTSTDADDIDRDWLSDNVFMRIESMYLVAAEANWRLGDLTQAASYITAITDERLDTTAFLWEDEYNDFKTGLATDSKLKDAIVYNWRIEMWGEGYGLDTFRRFGESRKRGGNHDYAKGMAIKPSDSYYNFSLPGSEITYNPYLGDKKTN